MIILYWCYMNIRAGLWEMISFYLVKTLTVFLIIGSLVSCGGSSSGSTETNVNTFLINSSSPDFGMPGDSISLDVEGATQRTSVVIRGINVVPDNITEDGSLVTFTIPDGASSGPLKIVSEGANSNSLWFTVSGTGVIAPIEAEIVTDELGNKVAIGYLLVSLFEENDTRDEADRLASLVSGVVVGRISIINGWQIKIDPGSLEGLKAIAAILEAESSVEFVVKDIEAKSDAVDWSKDPDRLSQRSRNGVEEGVALYERDVSPTEEGKVRPLYMSIGISEVGIDFNHPDFSDQKISQGGSTPNVLIFASNDASSDGEHHGSNVTGVVTAELGDQGNAGLIKALQASHGGANISVGIGHGFLKKVLGFKSTASRIAKTQQQLEAGSQVINWSWGFHKSGTVDCAGLNVEDNLLNDDDFNEYAETITKFFKGLKKQYPNAVIVASAGNGATDAGNASSRLPSSILSDQMIVVGAHTSGGSLLLGDLILTEDDYAASFSPTSCFDSSKLTSIKRAEYSNYGNRVDISASGTIMGLSNDTYANNARGTSFATPLVTATVALMQSINPNLTPANIKSLIRESALPINNNVVLSNSTNTLFTRALTTGESSGKGARLNVEGAIQKALDSLGEDTLPLADPVVISIDPRMPDVTKTISITIPSDGALFNKVDIIFLVDVSGSYGDDISTFRAKANELINSFSAFGSDVNIGLSSFSDFPVSPYGASNDYAFALDQPLTDVYNTVIDALNSLTILNGDDGPESQLEGLFQTSDLDSGWRAGALPILFLATDASFHNSDDESDYPGNGYNDTLAALNERDIRVFGLQSGGTVQDVVQIAEATGGQAFDLSRDSAEIINAIETALAETSKDISVVLEPNGDFGGFVKSITPSGVADANAGDPITNVNPGDVIAFDVVFSKGIFDDNATHTFSFRLRVVAEDIAVIQDIPVTITLN